MSEDTFNNALSHFIQDFAGGDAIRHLADLGYTAKEIHDKLDYPLSESVIGDIVWKHFVDTGVILLQPPGTTPIVKKDFIKETDAYGRSSFRMVTEPAGEREEGYVECDFGLLKQKDRPAYDEALSGLDEHDRDYIAGLPWPRQKVWHVADERMKRITAKYKSML